MPPSLVLHARGQKSSFFDLQRSNSEASTERSPNNLFAPLFEQRVLRCDVGYVITDATYFAIASLRAEEAVDLSASISDENNRHELSHRAGSTASPNAPTPIPLACGHIILHGQPPMRAHRCGGGLCRRTREVITISIILFIYYFLFYANPLLFHPSFSRPPHQAG